MTPIIIASFIDITVYNNRSHMCRNEKSNPGHSRYKGDALPTELLRRIEFYLYKTYKILNFFTLGSDNNTTIFFVNSFYRFCF